jgi:hypothetical protein
MVDSSASLLARIKQKKSQYSRSTAKTVKFKEGKTRVRLIVAPNLVTDDHIFGERDLGVHWIKIQKDGKPVAVVGDQELVYGKPSIINPAIEAAVKAAVDDETLAIIKDWKSKKSVLMNGIIRDGADASDDPQIIEFTPTTFGQILSIIETYIEDGRTDVLDPRTGIEFIVERKGKNKDTEYTVMVAPSMKPISPSVIDKAHNLDDFIAAEFFKGEEKKALNAIGMMIGKPVYSGDMVELGPSSTSMLTAAKPAPVESVIEHTARVAATAATVTAVAASEATVSATDDGFGAGLNEDELEKMLGDLDNI